MDAPNIQHIIHISPHSTLESYVQKFGRAGRTNIDSWATLYFNKSDITNNTLVDESIRKFCSVDIYLRKILREFFGFSCLIQERCCSNCNPELIFKLSVSENQKRKMDKTCTGILSEKIDDCLKDISDNFFLETEAPPLPTSNDIIENAEDILTEEDLLFRCEILQVECQHEISDILKQ